MFRLLDSPNQSMVKITVENEQYEVPEKISVAAAMLYCGLHSVRQTPVSGSERGPLCMMGVCFECLMKIDGKPNQRACQSTVKSGMIIDRQLGAATIEAYDESGN